MNQAIKLGTYIDTGRTWIRPTDEVELPIYQFCIDFGTISVNVAGIRTSTFSQEWLDKFIPDNTFLRPISLYTYIGGATPLLLDSQDGANTDLFSWNTAANRMQVRFPAGRQNHKLVGIFEMAVAPVLQVGGNETTTDGEDVQLRNIGVRTIYERLTIIFSNMLDEDSGDIHFCLITKADYATDTANLVDLTGEGDTNLLIVDETSELILFESQNVVYHTPLAEVYPGFPAVGDWDDYNLICVLNNGETDPTKRFAVFDLANFNSSLAPYGIDLETEKPTIYAAVIA